MRILPIFSIFLLSGFVANAQMISGVVNDYAPVTAINAADVTVITTTGFAQGDEVIVMQMKGATVEQVNTADYGNVVDYHSAGLYEYSSIASINGNIVTLSCPLQNNYDVSAGVQLIRVSSHTDVEISGAVTALPWDGSSGGVVAITASGTMTFNADINVSQQGFRGGEVLSLIHI